LERPKESANKNKKIMPRKFGDVRRIIILIIIGSTRIPRRDSGLNIRFRDIKK